MNLLGHAGQFLVCKRKLESKKDALLILSKELDNCQQERDQYRLMANQLRERHQGLKEKYRELIVREKHKSEFALFLHLLVPEINYSAISNLTVLTKATHPSHPLIIKTRS